MKIPMKKENNDKPPKIRKQLKTITIEIYICAVCGQDLETFGGDIMSAPSRYVCHTQDCGYEYERIPF